MGYGNIYYYFYYSYYYFYYYFLILPFTLPTINAFYTSYCQPIILYLTLFYLYLLYPLIKIINIYFRPYLLSPIYISLQSLLSPLLLFYPDCFYIYNWPIFLYSFYPTTSIIPRHLPLPPASYLSPSPLPIVSRNTTIYNR